MTLIEVVFMEVTFILMMEIHRMIGYLLSRMSEKVEIERIGLVMNGFEKN